MAKELARTIAFNLNFGAATREIQDRNRDQVHVRRQRPHTVKGFFTNKWGAAVSVQTKASGATVYEVVPALPRCWRPPDDWRAVSGDAPLQWHYSVRR